ncbi:hypothetical protein Ahy_A04g018847 isoform B [Arachis hypogaea]|uniref:Uncharacterized protein n=1 Tax=Arachis hypogaea TaxID=3818 RepID=A0A445DEQ3_ARAHY|nr:hypothetical protein Ahy_A04g018847 isoform B [Arachis hypogaea]
MEKGLSSITTSSSKEGLPLTPHSNFKTASTDDDLAHILFNIKSSKTSAVINYGASWYVYLFSEYVDEMYGAGEERLRDHVWLHS